jgi:hypothetical protein
MAFQRSGDILRRELRKNFLFGFRYNRVEYTPEQWNALLKQADIYAEMKLREMICKTEDICDFSRDSDV